MRGHVRKRGNTWAVVYDEGRDEDGKRVQKWKSGFATRRAAQAFLTRILSSLGDGSYVQPSKLTLGDYLSKEWLPALGDELAPLTITTYQAVVRSRILSRPWLKSLPLQSLTSAHVKRLLLELEQEKLSPATRKLTVRCSGARSPTPSRTTSSFVIRPPG